jgi:hypothetical protein
MYFFTRNRAVCHILEDEGDGKAPAPCGAKLGKMELMRLHSGRPTSLVVAEKPADSPLCKHCEKAEDLVTI